MSKFLPLAFLVLTVAECCLAEVLIFEIRDNPYLKPVFDKMCDNKTLIPSAQLDAIFNCKEPPSPSHQNNRGTPTKNDKEPQNEHDKGHHPQNNKGPPPENGGGPPPHQEQSVS